MKNEVSTEQKWTKKHNYTLIPIVWKYQNSKNLYVIWKLRTEMKERTSSLRWAKLQDWPSLWTEIVETFLENENLYNEHISIPIQYLIKNNENWT